jgi:Ca-activated chloride channel family protein
MLSASFLQAQTNKVKGGVTTLDTAELTILNIYPDSFPSVSVVFKAETKTGQPVWNLTKEKMQVKENQQACEVISLEKISKIKPINISVVIDHSGSMAQDASQLVDKDGKLLFSISENGTIEMPKGYVIPIDAAKKAVKEFASTFNFQKDYISIVGFSAKVDKILPLSKDLKSINSMVDGMNADANTALYDGMFAGVEQLDKADGLKVLVVLTDGWDNASTHKWKEVVEVANKNEIPVYIIGLGDVNADTLKQISASTRGQFFYAKSSNQLGDIYALIGKQIQAFYNLVYSSKNISEADTLRQVELSFDVDSLYLITHTSDTKVPSEVLTYLTQKEKEKQYWLYGKIALGTLVAAGILFFTFRSRKNKSVKPVIRKVFPNPSDGNIEIDFTSSGGQLIITNLSGQAQATISISGIENKFDFTGLNNGTYIATIVSGGQISNTVKFVVQK